MARIRVRHLGAGLGTRCGQRAASHVWHLGGGRRFRNDRRRESVGEAGGGGGIESCRERVDLPLSVGKLEREREKRLCGCFLEGERQSWRLFQLEVWGGGCG